MPAFVRLDPSLPTVAAFVSDDLALSVWEMLRRFRRPVTVARLADACALPASRVQSILDRAAALGLVHEASASGRRAGPRFRASGERILMEVDRGSPRVRALLGSSFRRFAAESRRCIDESMAQRARGEGSGPAMVSITHLVLDEAEARELIGLFRPVDEFVARVAEKHDRELSGPPRRCNYHVALHVLPAVTERLPPARMTFAEKGAKAAEVQASLQGRTSASGVLSPQERRVATLLARGSTIAEVAKEIGRSPSTVRTFTERIYRKLSITRRAQLASRLAVGGA